MFNQLFDEKEFEREFAEASSRIKRAQKEAEARKLQFDREFDEAEKRINARIAAHRKMHAESVQTHVHHNRNCYNNAAAKANRIHQQFVDEVNRQQFASFVNSMNMF